MSKNNSLFQFAPSLILIGGPSGTGKTSIINILIQSYSEVYARPISFTSRKRRLGETNREYVFVDRNDIYKMSEKGDILTVDEVYGNLYAISSESIDRILSQGRLPIKEVHPKNHEKIRKVIPNLIKVLITPVDDYKSQVAENRKRPNRKKEDDAYYSALDHHSFDIVLRTDFGFSPDTLAKHLHYCIYSHVMTKHYFPPAADIDKINADGYSKIAPEFFEGLRITTRNFHCLSRDYFIDAAARFIKRGMKCLEIGPGQGWLSNTISLEGIDYCGIDISQQMIMNSKILNNIQSSARLTAFPNQYFDIVLASLADPYLYPAAICEIRRVLKPGGIFIFSSPSRHWSDGLRDSDERLITKFKLSNGQDAAVYSFTFTMEELGRLLPLCGFDLLEHNEAHGNLLSEMEVSPAIIEAAIKTGIDYRQLPILNFVITERVD